MNHVRESNGRTSSGFSLSLTTLLIPIALFLVIGNSPVGSAPGNLQPGKLKLTILDSDSGQRTPTRVELQDSKGQGYIAEDALPAGGDCSGMGKEPKWDTLEEAIARLSKNVENTYTGTVQFYSAGQVETSLPPGTYQLRVFKGVEYQAQIRKLQIHSNETTELKVEMTRWVNMPEQGWFGADDHLHIARPVEGLNPYISKIMQAENIHVANLLQMGFYRHNITLQYAHGPGSIYQEGHYILATGQENPRTHFLGHAITLGARSAINFPENYVIYRLFWEEAQRQGALSGYAHYGATALNLQPAFGLAIDLPTAWLSFLEVLQFNRGGLRGLVRDSKYRVSHHTYCGDRLSVCRSVDTGPGAVLPRKSKVHLLTRIGWKGSAEAGLSSPMGPFSSFESMVKRWGKKWSWSRPAQ